MSKELDQFYTPQKTAEFCIEKILQHIPVKDFIFIEPSAGEGVFVKLLKKGGYQVKCFDIDPKCDCEKKDFLKHLEKENKFSVAIGNPPFGKKGKKAVAFINHALEIYDMVAFIVPKTLSYSYQAQKNVKGKLIFQEKLPEDKFIKDGKEVKIPSYFQIWVNEEDKRFAKYKNLRLKKPQTEHEELEIKIYNKTEGAKKWLWWDWDIAVKRNSKKGIFITEKEKITDECHWILIKGLTNEAKEILKQIDWKKGNDTKLTAGIGKADVVRLYLEKKENG